MASTHPRTEAELLERLSRIEGKAEIVNGEIIEMAPTGGEPGYVGDEIFVSLRNWARHHPGYRAVGDNKGFRVHLPNRLSLSPDAALYVGPNPGMKFYEGAPLFAVEVRSENDYGPAAEIAIATKRADYFAAGTRIVWDVDPENKDVIKAYDSENPETSRVFRHGDMADADSMVPG